MFSLYFIVMAYKIISIFYEQTALFFALDPNQALFVMERNSMKKNLKFMTYQQW